ncbi:hypothetical protein B0H16DRAFT_1762762 [Mycena metata]|uniref:MalT-like TPR region domain-containing protein n=1 Tax=Mycena metata TaxID=1033252 RepID=A0AAD7I993_9AGAR|nr:hypothetical protein B0H16DRAFT_1762762 [Mycena metata]
MALESSITGGDAVQQCSILTLMAHVKWRGGDSATALVFGRDAQRLAYQTTNLLEASRASTVIALALIFLGDYAGSITQLHNARELLRVCGMGDSDSDLHNAIAQARVHLHKSEYAEARAIHTQLLQDSANTPGAPSRGYALLNIAMVDVAIDAGRDIVEKSLQMANKIFAEAEYIFAMAYSDLISADLDIAEGKTALAEAHFQKCLRLSWGKDIEAVMYCLERLADVTRRPFNFPAKMRWTMVYLCQGHKLRDKLAFYKALLSIGELFINEDEARAHTLFIVALEGFTFMDVHRSRAQCMLQLGDVAKGKGETTKAAEFWGTARPLFERSLQMKDVAAIDMRLGTLEQDHQKSG